MSDRDKNYPKTDISIPLRTFDDLMHLTQHQADGEFEIGDREASFTVSSIIPGGSLVLWIEDGDDRVNYFLSMREFVEAAIKHYKQVRSCDDEAINVACSGNW